MHEILYLQIENNRHEILSPRLGEGRRNIGRAKQCGHLLDKVDALRLVCAQHRLSRRDEAESYRPSSDSPG